MEVSLFKQLLFFGWIKESSSKKAKGQLTIPKSRPFLLCSPITVDEALYSGEPRSTLLFPVRRTVHVLCGG